MIDFNTKAILTVIAGALVLLVVRPLIEPKPAIAQGAVSVSIVFVDIPPGGFGVVPGSVAVPVSCTSGCK